MSMNKGRILILVFLSSFILGMLFSANVYADGDFSENLEHEPYTPEIDIDAGWYDAIETFWYDAINDNPMEWIVSEPSGCPVDVKDKSNHLHTLQMYDGSGSTYPSAKYYFPNSDISTHGDKMKLSFWCLITTQNDGYIQLNLDNGDYIYLQFYQPTAKWRIIVSDTGQAYYSTNTFTPNIWYYVMIELTNYQVGGLPHGLYFQLQIIGSGVSKWDIVEIFTEKTNFESLDNLFMYTGITDISFYFYLDALNYYIDVDDFSAKYTQIQNIVIDSNLKLEVNYYVIDDSASFSLYDSIISEKADSDNNYRNYFITDNFINIDLLNCSRILRMKGTDTSQNKYKIIQLYFNDLNNTNAFRDGHNQSVRIRVDSFDSSNNLINKYYLNLEFNNSIGLLTWDADYRESLAIPRWNKEPTNPIFRFSDYLPENTNISEMEVSLQFFLTYNLTHRLFYIRTSIIFNKHSLMTYQYDKIIDGGSGSFYNTQSKIQVRYIDYFNMNNGSDYLGNRFYTYNNLRGLRTLKTNSTNYFFNFLECGYFSDILYYYIPPTPPEPIPPPPEPERPSGADYYVEYNTYIITSEIIDVELTNFTYQFSLLHPEALPAKFWFDYDAIAYLDSTNVAEGWGDWGWAWNWLRNGLAVIVCFFTNIGIGILNVVWLACQYLLFGVFVAFNFIVMYVIVGLILCEVLWNVAVYWIVYAFAYIANVIVLYLMPVLKWFFEVFLVWLIQNVFVPLLVLFLSVLAWLFSFGQASFPMLYDMIYDFVSYFADTFIQLIQSLFAHIPELVSYMIFYVIVLIDLYLKWLYTRQKGFIGRTEQLHQGIEGYLFLPKTMNKITKSVLDAIPKSK